MRAYACHVKHGYYRDKFRARGSELKFIKSKPFEYVQLGDEFVPRLSIIDVMMFNPIEIIKECLDMNYELV